MKDSLPRKIVPGLFRSPSNGSRYSQSEWVGIFVWDGRDVMAKFMLRCAVVGHHKGRWQCPGRGECECEHCASAVGANGDPAAQPISPELALGEKVKNELPALPRRSYFTPAPFHHIAPIFPHCTSPERFNGGGGHRWRESSVEGAALLDTIV